MRFTGVLVPLDGRADALAALPVAATLATIEQATLHVVHVGRRAVPARELARDLGLTPEQLRGSVLDQTTGRPAEGILRFAEREACPLIVLCTHTGEARPRGALGSVAEALLCGARCPLVLVQPRRGLGRWTLNRVLLPHDGTPATMAAMEPAGELAHRAGAEILVLHVASRGARRPSEPGTLTVPRYLDQPQHEWPAWVHEFLNRLIALGHPPAEVALRFSVAAGEPGPEIVKFARDHAANLIALAWHGRWETAHAATLKTVIRDAPAPVLVTRAAEEARVPEAAASP